MSKGTVARATIVGRMGAAAEVKTIGQGEKQTRVANISLAVNDGWGDSQTTSWFNVQLFGDKRIDAVVQYADKGTKLFVEGQLRIRKYQKGDENRYATEIVVGYDGVVEILSTKEEREGNASAPKSAPPPRDADLDDDVPF